MGTANGLTAVKKREQHLAKNERTISKDLLDSWWTTSRSNFGRIIYTGKSKFRMAFDSDKRRIIHNIEPNERYKELFKIYQNENTNVYLRMFQRDNKNDYLQILRKFEKIKLKHLTLDSFIQISN